jgi:ketosteroid isomerase-like protein
MSTQPIFEGGTAADRARLLEVHQMYLAANGWDTTTLRKIWSDNPTSMFFNLNGHTYVGLEHWLRLWDFYGPRMKTVAPWVSFDMKVIIRGDMAVISCHRTSQVKWEGETAPEKGWMEKELRSRSTEVFVKERGDWKLVHAHFSVAGDGERPGGI